MLAAYVYKSFVTEISPLNHSMDRDCEDSSAGNSFFFSLGLVVRFPKNLKPTAQADPHKEFRVSN